MQSYTTATQAVALFPGETASEPFLLEASDLLHGVPARGGALVVTRGPTQGRGSCSNPNQG